MTVRDGTVSDERLADRFDAILSLIENGEYYHDYDRAISDLRTLREVSSELSRRSVPSEPVATMHKSEHETLFSKGWVPSLMGFTSTPLYPSPASKPEVTEAEIRAELERMNAAGDLVVWEMADDRGLTIDEYVDLFAALTAALSVTP